jgi:hypothetical protein
LLARACSGSSGTNYAFIRTGIRGFRGGRAHWVIICFVDGCDLTISRASDDVMIGGICFADFPTIQDSVDGESAADSSTRPTTSTGINYERSKNALARRWFLNKMKTAPTNKKVRELIGMVREKKLLPRPEFQRRLVWTHRDKDHFIDSILRGYPFPEIYLADGDVDLVSGEGTQLLVDGLQRVSTIIEYFEASPNLKLLTVLPYKELDEEHKKAFLQYDVAVRDIGSVRRDELIEVFKRINATKYSLLDIEVNNAVYAGELKKYAEKLASHQFFLGHNTFNAQDFKRMGDLRYALTLVITLMEGYFNRDDAFGDLLQRFNDEFALEAEIEQRLTRCFDFIDECGFSPKSRIWKKADLFTVIIELDLFFLTSSPSALLPSDLLGRLETFYNWIEPDGVSDGDIAGIYYKASIQATNDRVNRLRRGTIIGGIIAGSAPVQILETLKERGLV